MKDMASSVGVTTFLTEWKVIQVHGSKPPTSDLVRCMLDTFGIYIGI